ncbi:MAG: recombination protein RecR [Planctomycetia bacterium TMED53]|nr:MAG: recombination protein RecR [Planctomycetia bacterium TMED53]
MAEDVILGELITAFSKLPGIGAKSAERLAYHVLKISRSEAMELAEAIRRVKDDLRRCSECLNICERELCEICEDDSRDSSTVLVVEQPKDLRAIEGSGAYQGKYHVLGATFSPMDERGPEHLSLDRLLERCRSGQVKEVILALNPDFEGDGTTLLITESLADQPVSVTRLARGLPSGGQIEYMNQSILRDAVEGRGEFGGSGAFKSPAH